jgi:hypothetical protein
MPAATDPERTMSDDADQPVPRVAVIAVHGVADQAAGDTARAVAELLIRTSDKTVDYGTAHEETLTFEVDPVPPMRELDASGDSARKSRQKNRIRPDTFPQRLKKLWRQSYGSDFHRKEWAVDATTTSDPMVTDSTAQTPLSPGPDLTEFILFKALRNKMERETYRTTRLSLPREQGGTASRVDVYEMHWADLSRLSGSLPLIVTELFTLLFRLSLLGRDTVRIALAHMRSPGPAWIWLRKSQTALDWTFSRVFALLMLQLVMLALILVPMGLLRCREGKVATLALAALVFGGYLAWCYRRSGWQRTLPAALGAMVLAGLAGWASRELALSGWIVGLLWLLGLSALYKPVMEAVESRFPLTATSGWALWVLVVVTVLAGAVAGAAPGPGLERWIGGALWALEGVLTATIVTWVLIAMLALVWLVAGFFAARSDEPHARATVSTGRFGVFVSGSFFLVLVMAIWAMVSGLLEMAVVRVDYTPVLFKTTTGMIAAAEFLGDRYNSSTELFSLIAAIDLLLLAYLLIFFLPSVLAELKVRRLEPRRLGEWLAIGYRYLDTRPIRWLTYLSALATLAVASYLAWWQLYRSGLVSTDPAIADAWGGDLLEKVKAFSRDTLSRLVIAAASVTLALSAFGRLLSRYVPWVRAPLDVALDVDNHFREFPRKLIPRARIMARYVALLRHIDAQHYDRIVVVAHSQGTVISAELLHYMHERGQRNVPGDETAALVNRIAAKTRLLTLGCPLRQLYAARFPTLYAWVLAQHGDVIGPRAADLGVQRWVNAFTTGDYVGRWLWTRRPAGDLSVPLIDVRPDAGSVYTETPRRELEARLAAGAQTDVCLGGGAHTHYLEPVHADDRQPDDATAVVHLIDRLIAGYAAGPASQPAGDAA